MAPDVEEEGCRRRVDNNATVDYSSAMCDVTATISTEGNDSQCEGGNKSRSGSRYRHDGDASWRRGFEKEASPVNGYFEANEKGIKKNINTSSCRDPPHTQHNDDALTHTRLSFSSLSVLIDPVEK